ncbi:MAG TPA: (Fe-S)-binding protein [Thiobacillaceae bacterium]|nr:(Fe-S)-binding protein [Thiobacillaceae bacterium]HNU64988.1 (Fe-S)-binding protein [Thiobacillaceae bacterium]
MSSLIYAGVFMALLGLMLAWMLAMANRRLHVFEDPRIDRVEEMLPRSNCGACGTAGCRNFAEELVAGRIEPARCTVNTMDANVFIARFLGVDPGKMEKRVARLACAGGHHVARMRARYEGLGTCRAAAVAGGGGKACAWGCLGLGDCETVCDFDAITMNPFSLPVVDADRCTACGDCIEVCPKDLFSLQPISHQLWVACKNRADGDTAELQCEVACTACGKCVADAPAGLMRLERELAVIDYARNDLATPLIIERCPTGAIVWLERHEAKKGRGAKRILRTTPLPLESGA